MHTEVQVVVEVLQYTVVLQFILFRPGGKGKKNRYTVLLAVGQMLCARGTSGGTVLDLGLYSRVPQCEYRENRLVDHRLFMPFGYD